MRCEEIENIECILNFSGFSSHLYSFPILGTPDEAAPYAHDAQFVVELWALQEDGGLQASQGHTGQ